MRDEKTLSSECALLVISCDAYSDLWKPFFCLLSRYWPDCPFDKFLGSDTLSYNDSGVRPLRFSGGRDWSLCMKECLEQLSSEYVLVMLDDFFLRRKVGTSQVLHCLDFAKKHDATQVRLIPRPGPTTRIEGENLVGESESGSPYRLCAQAAIWNRSKLRDLLRIGESVWDFEHNGNARVATQAGGFYSVWRSALPYKGAWAHHVVEKGLWLPEEKWIFGRMNIGCDFSRRGTLPWARAIFYHLAQLADRLLDPLPWRFKVRTKRAVKVLMRPFFKRALDKLGRSPQQNDPNP